MITKNVTTTREIPGELGQSMTFRQLGWRQLAEAEEMRSALVLRNLKNMGGELLRDLQSINREQVTEQAAAQAADDPLAKYDQATVLRAGIAAWSYPERLTPDAIDSLDVATARWAAAEIIGLGAPPLEKEVETSFFGSQGGSMATPATQTIAVSAALGSTPNGSSA